MIAISSNVKISAATSAGKKAAVVGLVGEDGSLHGDQGLLDNSLADALKERGRLLTSEAGDYSVSVVGETQILALRVSGDSEGDLRSAGAMLAKAAKKHELGEFAVLCPTAESA